jgi:hypothetical protein
MAAYRGAPNDIIKALIGAGVDPKAEDQHGKTPADVASENNKTETASFIEQFYQPTKSANFNI